mgnify:CR=1 FL=1|jgi:hypothetical protein|nr:MAG TPA: hypothetical protein [Caudoviricetes sp.]
MATTKKETEIIAIPAIDIRNATITLKGDSPLIVHKWSEKAKKMMLDKQMKVATTKGHDAKDPFADFVDTIYFLSGKPERATPEVFEEALSNGARFGFPSVGVKASAVSAGFRAGVTKNLVSMNGAFHIDEEYVEIKGVPQIREDMVRVGMGTADIRYRAEFPEWSTTFVVKYNAGVISLAQLCNLFNLGGFAVGIGEWRPEKGGTYGRYHVC